MSGHIDARQLPGGAEAEDQHAEQAGAEGGGQDAPIRPSVENDIHEREFGNEGVHQDLIGPTRQQQAARPAYQRKQEALRQELPHQAEPSRAEGEADGDLAAARGTARQQHVGQIEAGNQQHGAGNADQQERGDFVRVLQGIGRDREP